MKLTRQVLTKRFYDLGVNPGDSVMVHASYSTLGWVEHGPKTVLHTLLDLLGPGGTLAAPSFNWSIHRNNPMELDIKNTPSEMGVLSELFRTHRGVKRTAQLFHPFSVYGKYQKQILDCDTYDTWGENSPYGFMYRNDFKILLLGVDLNACSVMHYCEQKARVWYREYVKHNGHIIQENRERVRSEFKRLALKEGCVIDLNRGKSSLNEINCAEAVVGNAVCRLIQMKPFVDEVVKQFSSNKNYLLLEEELFTPMRVLKDQDHYQPMTLIKDLHLKNRSLVTEDFDESLEYIQKIIPLKIREFKSGQYAQTWRIPRKWVLKEAYIEKQGQRIVDVKDHPLHVYSYSQPFEGEVSKEELFKHISTDPDWPEAIPYRFIYYKKDWGFSVKHKDLPLFDQEKYFVKIDAAFEDGFLKVGEFGVKGSAGDTVLICLHLDHPGQCNDNLSGVAVGVALALHLKRMPHLKHSYKILFLPETIGSMAYLDRYREVLKQTKFGLVFDAVGSKNRMFMMKTLEGGTYIDKVCEHVLKHRYQDAEVYPFLDPAIAAFSNDERVMQSPGFELPTVAFSRAMDECYHSSLDSPENISQESLDDTLEMLKEVIGILETNYVPKRRYDGTPFLSQYGLWDDNWTVEETSAVERLFFHINNQLDILSIAEKIDRPFSFVFDFIEKMRQSGLIEKPH